jgi:hypothetical protein
MAAGAPEGKVATVGEFAGTGKEVEDPVGQGLAAYERCARQLEEVVADQWDPVGGGPLFLQGNSAPRRGHLRAFPASAAPGHARRPPGRSSSG